VAHAHQEPTEHEDGERPAAREDEDAHGEHARADHNRAPQVVREEETDRNVGSHARESEGAGDEPDLPVRERAAACELGQDRGEGAGRERGGEDPQAEEREQ